MKQIKLIQKGKIFFLKFFFKYFHFEMEIFFKKTFDSWEFFEKELDDFCDEYFLILRKEDCKLFNETDKMFDTSISIC